MDISSSYASRAYVNSTIDAKLATLEANLQTWVNLEIGNNVPSSGQSIQDYVNSTCSSVLNSANNYTTNSLASLNSSISSINTKQSLIDGAINSLITSGFLQEANSRYVPTLTAAGLASSLLNNSNAASANTVSIASISSRVGSAENNISILLNSMNSNTNNILSATNSANALSNSVSSLEGRLVADENNININTTNISTINSAISTITNNLNTTTSVANWNTMSIMNNETNILENTNNINTLNNEVGFINNTLVSSGIINYFNGSYSVSNLLVNLPSSITNISNSFTTLQSSVAANQNEIDSLVNSLATSGIINNYNNTITPVSQLINNSNYIYPPFVPNVFGHWVCDFNYIQANSQNFGSTMTTWIPLVGKNCGTWTTLQSNNLPTLSQSQIGMDFEINTTTGGFFNQNLQLAQNDTSSLCSYTFICLVKPSITNANGGLNYLLDTDRGNSVAAFISPFGFSSGCGNDQSSTIFCTQNNKQFDIQNSKYYMLALTYSPNYSAANNYSQSGNVQNTYDLNSVKQVNLYINGELMATAAVKYNFSALVPGLGCSNSDNSANTFNGTFCCVTVYDRNLSQSEILIYKNYLLGKYPQLSF